MAGEISFGQRLAEKVASVVGSWRFIICQTLLLTIWVVLNSLHIIRFDAYPFILLNLFLSLQAAYTGPMILIAANRQSEIDRQVIHQDFELDMDSNRKLQAIEEKVDRLLKEK